MFMLRETLFRNDIIKNEDLKCKSNYYGFIFIRHLYGFIILFGILFLPKLCIFLSLATNVKNWFWCKNVFG